MRPIRVCISPFFLFALLRLAFLYVSVYVRVCSVNFNDNCCSLVTKQLCWPQRVHEEPPSSVLTCVRGNAHSPDSDAAVHSHRRGNKQPTNVHAPFTHTRLYTLHKQDVTYWSLAQDWLACILINKIIAVKLNCQKKKRSVSNDEFYFLAFTLSRCCRRKKDNLVCLHAYTCDIQ